MLSSIEKRNKEIFSFERQMDLFVIGEEICKSMSLMASVVRRSLTNN